MFKNIPLVIAVFQGLEGIGSNPQILICSLTAFWKKLSLFIQRYKQKEKSRTDANILTEILLYLKPENWIFSLLKSLYKREAKCEIPRPTAEKLER